MLINVMLIKKNMHDIKDFLLNKHKQKEPNFQEFLRFFSVQILKVHERFYFISKRVVSITSTVLICFNMFNLY